METVVAFADVGIGQHQADEVEHNNTHVGGHNRLGRQEESDGGEAQLVGHVEHFPEPIVVFLKRSRANERRERNGERKREGEKRRENAWLFLGTIDHLRTRHTKIQTATRLRALEADANYDAKYKNMRLVLRLGTITRRWH